jgi:hypothetical protein
MCLRQLLALMRPKAISADGLLIERVLTLRKLDRQARI